ncbi:hypothetical protein NL676_025765 [Syzygium grande]|nr:hypothetical protein NL676_025765 [Syzygium grande]
MSEPYSLAATVDRPSGPRTGRARLLLHHSRSGAWPLWPKTFRPAWTLVSSSFSLHGRRSTFGPRRYPASEVASVMAWRPDRGLSKPLARLDNHGRPGPE